jgi:hypothetical protein
MARFDRAPTSIRHGDSARDTRVQIRARMTRRMQLPAPEEWLEQLEIECHIKKRRAAHWAHQL